MEIGGETIMQNFIGKDGFIWWMGVIEQRNDPLKLGRCRVRIFGWHSENLQQMPTEELPWASPCISPNSVMLDSSPLIGDYVFGFFSDGLSAQAPIIMGMLPGIVTSGPTADKGFSDGTDYPVGEPTTSRLYRNEKVNDTPIGYHNNNLDVGVPTASGGSWSEPKSSYNTKPPYNNVTETISGHVFELDDTPGSERIHLAHKANTFFEIAPDGSKVTKVSGKNYEIYLSDNNVHIKGTCNITIDGNANFYVKGNVTEKVDGAYTLNATGPIVINGETVNINNGTKGAARVGDTADTGDDGTGSHFDTNSAGTNIIETGSGTVFIGD